MMRPNHNPPGATPTTASARPALPARCPRALAGLALALALLPVVPADGSERLRLLIRSDDLPRIRHVCGVGAGGADRGWGRFGRGAVEFNGLRRVFMLPCEDAPLPGELLAAAFVQIVDPADPANRQRLSRISATLRRSDDIMVDALELALAAGWVWPLLEPAARQEYIAHACAQAQPLKLSDSPLDARTFREKLAWLALALGVNERDERSAAWDDARLTLLLAAHRHLEQSFPNYLAWRGRIPTSSAAAADEELLTALFVELQAAIDPAAAWPQHHELGAWLEHYVFSAAVFPDQPRQFLRDDGAAAPATPVSRWQWLYPLTAHLLAARTGHPAAATVALAVERKLRAAEPIAASAHPASVTRRSELFASNWAWVPLAFDLEGRAALRLEDLPPARNFGGAVLFRQPGRPAPPAVWIEAGQPFLRRRQHFDAGHFFAVAGDYLTVRGGEDIAFQAQPQLGGEQRLGVERSSFDFEQYYTSTIAHNGLVCYDQARALNWYGARYLPAGGQRPIEATCSDWQTPLDAQRRVVARMIAYGRRGLVGYLALDLAPAYDSRTIRAYTREFALLPGPDESSSAALVLIDRLALTSARAVPAVILNLPTRPLADDRPLAAGVRIAGRDNHGGVWRFAEVGALSWRAREAAGDSSPARPAAVGESAAARLVPLGPTQRKVRVVGGPAELLTIPKGEHAGRRYVGGSSDSFERLILPAERREARNAWFRLGEPTLLGESFSTLPHWGRIEIEPAAPCDAVTFVQVLFLFARGAPLSPPEARLLSAEGGDGDMLVEIRFEREAPWLIELPGNGPGGSIKSGDDVAKTLPTSVEADEPLEAGE